MHIKRLAILLTFISILPVVFFLSVYIIKMILAVNGIAFQFKYDGLYDLMWISLFTFLPALSYYRIGKTNIKQTRKLSVSIAIMFLAILIFTMPYTLSRCTRVDACGWVGPTSITWPLFLILYIVALYLKSKSKSLNSIR